MSDIRALISGFNAFHQNYRQDKDGRYRKLAEYGPHSKILMIACCDSRADPAIITNSSAGDLMVIRNMANLVPPYREGSDYQETQAALEFAVSYLQVEHIIVMGHSRCGGIRSLLTRLLDDSDPSRALERWTAVAEPAARAVLHEMPHAGLDAQTCTCSRRALAASLDNLRSYPWVYEAEKKRRVQLHGWYFNLSSGELECYREGSGKFEALY